MLKEKIDVLYRQKRKFTILDNPVLEDRDLDKSELMVYWVLCYYADKNGTNAFPSLTTICQKTRCSKPTILKAIKSLIKYGYITKEERRNPNAPLERESNLYTIVNLTETVVKKDTGVVKKSTNGGKKEYQPGGKKEYQYQDPPSYPNSLNKKVEYDSDFDTWYHTYPRKISKKLAYKAWRARIKEGVKVELLFQALNNYLGRIIKEKILENYVLHPATFLGPNERWKDYLEQKPKISIPKTEIKICPECGGEMLGKGSPVCMKCGWSKSRPGAIE